MPILYEETKAKFGYDVATFSTCFTKQVVVRCDVCKKVYELAQLQQHHYTKIVCKCCGHIDSANKLRGVKKPDSFQAKYKHKIIDKYSVRKQSVKQIATGLGISTGTVYLILKQAGISTAPKSKHYDVAKIIDLYVNQKLSGPEIAVKLGISSESVVYDILRKHKSSKADLGKEWSRKYDEEAVIDLYVNHQLSSIDVAKKLNIPNYFVVYAILKRHNVSRRTLSEAYTTDTHKVKVCRKAIEKETLIREYVENGLSIEQVAAKFNTNYKHISKSLRKHSIARRNPAELINTPEYREKMREGMGQYGGASVSTQQIYIFNLYGGELNKLINKRYFVDIFLAEDNLVVEVDASGHNMFKRTFAGVDNKKVEQRDRIREMYLRKELGYNIMRIIARRDKFPSDEKLKEMLEYARSYFLTKHTWIYFDLDKGTVRTSQFDKSYDYGELRNINKQTELLKKKVKDSLVVP